MEETEEGNAAAGEGRKNRGAGGGDHCGSCLINDVVGEELLTEILIRLPTDQIFRCKSVCKHWLSVIRTPHFAAFCTKQKNKQRKKMKKKKKLSCNLHPHRQQNSPVLITTNDEGLKFSLDFVPDFPQLHGANNYNDLLQQAADDKENYVNEMKLLLRLNTEQVILNAQPDGEHKKQRIQDIINDVDRIRRLSPQRHYSNRDFIVGSSNGLLLCAPLLHNSRQGFDDFAPIYVVCNPYTKQWLQVPPPPLPAESSSSSISPHAANVGFVSDFDSSGGCWFKIVRLPLELDLESTPSRQRSLKLQVFSSHSWEWTTVAVPSPPRPRSSTTESSAITMPSLPWPIWADKSNRIVVAVTLKKNGGPRLCWLVDSAWAIVYDPIKNLVDAVIGVKQPSDVSIAPMAVVFDAICVSKGCLWAGNVGSRKKLKIYKASGKKWKMVEEFDIPHAYKWRFMAMNPDDPRKVYLKAYDSVALLNLRTKTLKVVRALKKKKNPSFMDGLKGLTIVCDDPPWPTSLPSPFPSS